MFDRYLSNVVFAICHPRFSVLTITSSPHEGITEENNEQTMEENTHATGIDPTPKTKLDVAESAGNGRKKSKSIDIQINSCVFH